MSTFRHQNLWRYEFWKFGIRHRQAGFPSKEAALLAQAEARKNLKGTNTDFIGLCESRLKDLERRRTRQHFLENKRLFDNLILRWGKKKEITRQEVQAYLDEKKSNYVYNRELRFLKALFNYGLEHELFGNNPAARIKMQSVDSVSKYIPPKEDIEKVLAACTPKQRLYLLAAINTMARIREINRLKWEDVHEDYLILRTRKAKNSNLTARKIPLNETLKKVLTSLPKVGEYVFCYSTGKPYGYRSKMLRRSCEKAGVRPFAYHALRHYGASTLANAGVPLTDIQALLGHQRATTTDLYLQTINDGLKEAVKKLGSPI